VILINILIDHLLGILNLGCYGIRIRRYVSNGFCTSRKAIRDTICDGRCLPMDELPFFPQFSKILSKRKKEWRCVPDYVKRRKVTVFCNDGTKRRYRIPVVRTCKCKRYMKKQNMTNPPGQLKKGSKSRWKTTTTPWKANSSDVQALHESCEENTERLWRRMHYTHLLYNKTVHKLYPIRSIDRPRTRPVYMCTFC